MFWAVAHAATWTVDPTVVGSETIQAVLDQDVVLPGDTLLLVDGTHAGHAFGSLTDLTLQGSGASVLVPDGGGPAVISIDGGTLRLVDVTVDAEGQEGGIIATDANLSLERVVVTGAEVDEDGGGLLLENSLVNLTEVVIEGCTAESQGGGLAVQGGSEVTGHRLHLFQNVAERGGGLFVDDDAEITLTEFRVEGSVADTGGGIYSRGRVSMVEARIEGNTAMDDGGGIHVQRGNLQITNANIEHNSGRRGAGLSIQGGGVGDDDQAELNRLVLQDNIAEQEGGAIWSNRALLMRNAAFCHNDADNRAAALYMRNDAALDAAQMLFWQNGSDPGVATVDSDGDLLLLHALFAGDGGEAIDAEGFQNEITHSIFDGGNVNITGIFTDNILSNGASGPSSLGTNWVEDVVLQDPGVCERWTDFPFATGDALLAHPDAGHLGGTPFADFWDADDDADGFLQHVDCDDQEPLINPDATEACNGIDDDCDGAIDNGAHPTTWYLDTDGDGFGSSTSALACTVPDHHVDNDRDCDDLDDQIHPHATEICNDIDDDCDQTTDVGATDAPSWYLDDDGDGFGVLHPATTACDAPDHHVADHSDCNDTDANIRPDAIEACVDEVDNDCDGLTDAEDPDFEPGAILYGPDHDGDGVPTDVGSVSACNGQQPHGFLIVGANVDCDDTDHNRSPLHLEVCDGIDNDCVSGVDNGLLTLDTYPDHDGDGFGDSTSSPLSSCAPPVGRVQNAADCNDADADIHPNALEVCDGIDQDCMGGVDDGLHTTTTWPDADGDGFGDASASSTTTCDPASVTGVANDDDCDDHDALVYPGASEDPFDGIDSDCDGAVESPPTPRVDTDGDGIPDSIDGNPAAAGSAQDVVPGEAAYGCGCRLTPTWMPRLLSRR